MEMYVRFCREVGYDYVFMVTGFSLPRSMATATDTAESRNHPGGERYRQRQHGCQLHPQAEVPGDAG